MPISAAARIAAFILAWTESSGERRAGFRARAFAAWTDSVLGHPFHFKSEPKLRLCQSC